MADSQHDPLAPLRQLVAGTEDPDQLELVAALVDLVAHDTDLVLEQIHSARDIAARTKAGAWIGNTELAEIMDDADHFVKRYKTQRDDVAQLKSALQAKQPTPES